MLLIISFDVESVFNHGLNRLICIYYVYASLDSPLMESTVQQLRFVRSEHDKQIHNAFKRALLGKDKLIEEISKHRDQLEADLNAFMLRVESIEKENASLRYEVRVLEKELEIRHQETEFNRRTADVAQKQQQESAKRIAKLETECVRLRLLVRKRLPGPAALKRMKNEVEMLGVGKDQTETRRRKTNPSSLASSVEKLHMMEEENRIDLKYAVKNNLVREQSLATLSDFGSDDKGSCAESCASATISSQLEHFKNEKRLGTPSRSYMETSDMNLMDDFAEMEKLAVDYHHSSEESSSIIGPSRTPELLIWKTREHHGPFDDLLKMLFDHSRALKRNPHEVLEDTKVSLVHNSSGTTPFNGKDQSFGLDASGKGNDKEILTTKQSDKKLESNLSTPIQKIIELLEGINVISKDDGKVSPCKNSATPTGYTVRVFQWRTAELSAILQQFVLTCHDLLNGKADLEQFARLVASSLERVMNHCFSIQDVSSMKDAIRNGLEWDESTSESEVDSGSANVKEEAEKAISKTANKEFSTVDLEDRLQSSSVEVESLRPQLEISKDVTGSWETEMETVKQSEGISTVDVSSISLIKLQKKSKFLINLSYYYYLLT